MMAGERKPGVPSDEEPTVVPGPDRSAPHSCGSPPGQQRRAGDGLQVAGLVASRRGPAWSRHPNRPPRRKRPKRRSLTRPSDRGAGRPGRRDHQGRESPRRSPGRPAWRLPFGGRGEVFVCHNIYDPLITFDEQLNPRLGAVSIGWELDEKTMILKLRKEVSSTTGPPSTPRPSSSTSRTPRTATRSLFISDLEPIQSVDVVDTHRQAEPDRRWLGAPGGPRDAGDRIDLADRPGRSTARTSAAIGRGRAVPVRRVGPERPHHAQALPGLLGQERAYLDEVTPGGADPTVRLSNLRSGSSTTSSCWASRTSRRCRSSRDLQLFRTWQGARTASSSTTASRPSTTSRYARRSSSQSTAHGDP